jgi:hypothetical protein
VIRSCLNFQSRLLPPNLAHTTRADDAPSTLDDGDDFDSLAKDRRLDLEQLGLEARHLRRRLLAELEKVRGVHEARVAGGRCCNWLARRRGLGGLLRLHLLSERLQLRLVAFVRRKALGALLALFPASAGTLDAAVRVREVASE